MAPCKYNKKKLLSLSISQISKSNKKVQENFKTVFK